MSLRVPIVVAAVGFVAVGLASLAATLIGR